MATPNWKNRTLFHGDNLKFMRAMNSESVDLIATDPPFNKGKDFHATPDSVAAGAKFQDRWSWETDVHEEWVDQIKDDYPHVMNVIQGSRSSYGDDMGAFLCFMAVRLISMRRLLKPTGSIYLHCDPTASHYLKELMDAVFGKKNFRNEIVWCYTDPAGRRNTEYYKRTHDIIFWYSKDHRHCTTNKVAKAPLSDSTIRRYGKYFDENGQVTYERLKASSPGAFQSLKSVPADLSEVWLDKNLGTTASDWWTDFIPVKRKGKGQTSESTGYPTQKPLSLYARIIETSTHKDEIVLDPFAGCATTLVAAERLDRKWVGIDLWDKAHEVIVERLSSEGVLGKDLSFSFNEVTLTTTPPDRTDDGEVSAPYLRPKTMIKEPEGPKYTRQQMYDHLLDQYGSRCQGCDRWFDDSRYLELDHNTPRSDGGLNHISNRILLCGPCNRLKSNTYTLAGLRKENKKRGYMAGGK